MNIVTSLDLSSTPHVTVRPVAQGMVDLVGVFWSDRLNAIRADGLTAQFAHCEATGRIQNFVRAAGHQTDESEFEGYKFNDSDVYKWVEAASYVLAWRPSVHLEHVVNSVIAMIASA